MITSDNTPDLQSFLVSDARKWQSADAAAILHNLRGRLRNNLDDPDQSREGRIWIGITINEWTDDFPWLSIDQLQRLLKRLASCDVLIIRKHRQSSKDPFNQVTRYTLNEPEFMPETPFELTEEDQS